MARTTKATRPVVINKVSQAEGNKVVASARKRNKPKVELITKADMAKFSKLLPDMANSINEIRLDIRTINLTTRRLADNWESFNGMLRKLANADWGQLSKNDPDSLASQMHKLCTDRGMTPAYAEQAVYCMITACKDKVELRTFNKAELVKQMKEGLPHLTIAGKKVTTEKPKGVGGRKAKHVAFVLESASKKPEFVKVLSGFFDKLKAHDDACDGYKDDDVIELFWKTLESMGHAEHVPPKTKDGVAQWKAK